MSVRLLNPVSDRSDSIVRQIAEQAEVARERLGADLAGFVLVAWDMRGQAHSVIQCSSGPVSEALAPTYAHDVLNRHVAVVLSETTTSEALGDA